MRNDQVNELRGYTASLQVPRRATSYSALRHSGGSRPLSASPVDGDVLELLRAVRQLPGGLLGVTCPEDRARWVPLLRNGASQCVSPAFHRALLQCIAGVGSAHPRLQVALLVHAVFNLIPVLSFQGGKKWRLGNFRFVCPHCKDGSQCV